MWEKLGDLPVPEPSLALRVRWEQTLGSAVASREIGPAHPRAWRQNIWPANPAWQMAIAGLCLTIGLAAGAYLQRDAVERDEVASTKEMVAVSLLQQQSATERLRGVDYSERMPSMEPPVVTALIQAVNRDSNVAIEVPVNTNLQLRTINGSSINVTGVNGDSEIQDTNGSITLTNISGSVIAHTLNGAVTASLDRVASNKPMSFTSMNGKVDVTLPADTKARLRLKSDNGSIYSDFDVKLEPDTNNPVVEDTRSQNGKDKISVNRAVTGTINGGGPEYTFQTMNGNILIHKK